MPNLRIVTFGPPQIIFQDTPIKLPRRKATALFIYLVLNRRAVSRVSLSTFFWSDLDASRGLARLRRVLVDLNKTPLKQYIEANQQTIGVINTDDIWIDVVAFQAVTHESQHADVLEAIKLYRGDFLDGFTLSDSLYFDEWQSLQTQILHQRAGSLLNQAVSNSLEIQDWSKVIELAYQWIAMDIIAETPYYFLMKTYNLQGQRAKALQVYNALAEVLEVELGTTPSAEIKLMRDTIAADSNLSDSNLPKNPNLPEKPALLIGRDKAIQHLTNLTNSAANQTVVICGLPGVGKTTLMKHLVHDNLISKQFGHQIFWASLGEAPKLGTTLMQWAQYLNIGVHHEAPIATLQQKIRDALQDKRALLVIDDVWEVDHALTLQVGGAKTQTIITTREIGIANKLITKPDNLYRLPILDDEYAQQLLKTLAPTVVAQYPDESRKLVQSLEGLPLAIKVAGHLLQSEIGYGWGIADLLAEIQDGVRLLEAQAPIDRFDTTNQILPTVSVLLQRSTDRLTPEVRVRFALLGVFAAKPAHFDSEAVQAVWQTADVRSTLRTLVERGLLEPIGQGVFQMHALLAMHARSLFGAESQR